MQEEDLISLQPHLISIMQASLLGQENLLMPFHQGREQSETADTCTCPLCPGHCVWTGLR